jgi:hypothetical protein
MADESHVVTFDSDSRSNSRRISPRWKRVKKKKDVRVARWQERHDHAGSVYKVHGSRVHETLRWQGVCSIGT